MSKSNFEIILLGKKSEYYYQIKTNILDYLSFIDLPLKIIEKEDQYITEVIYGDNTFSFNEESKTDVLQDLYNFLIKINPKNGKICKCSDCKNCPSKRLNAIRDK